MEERYVDSYMPRLEPVTMARPLHAEPVILAAIGDKGERSTMT
jgi:hypothetical protein